MTEQILILLLGVVAGAAVNQVTRRLDDRSRNKREDRLRFIDDRRALYARFLAAEEALQDAQRSARMEQRNFAALRDVADPDTLNAGLIASADHMTATRRAWLAVVQEMRLMAPAETLDALGALMAHSPSTDGDDYSASLAALHDSMRRDLGVTQSEAERRPRR